MRNYLVISMLAAGLGLPAMAAAQTRSVDDYVCTFAGTCPADEAESAEEQAPAAAGERRGRTSSTRGFSLARPGATSGAAAPASVKSTARKAPPAKPAVKSASATKSKTVVKPVAASGQRADLRLSFELASATLTPMAMAEAKVFAESLMRPELANMKFAIEGHTDAQGGRDYNVDLSRRRAQAVADYLVSLGVSPDRLEVRGFGYDRPLQGRSAASQDNRRVEAVRTS